MELIVGAKDFSPLGGRDFPSLGRDDRAPTSAVVGFVRAALRLTSSLMTDRNVCPTGDVVLLK